MKNLKYRFGIIIGVALISVLIILPRTPITFKNERFSFLNIDTEVGGYVISLAGGKYVLDLREFRKGLDISGGARVVLQANMEGIEEPERDAALESARQVISRRVDLLGVSEPLIQTSRAGDDYRIIVELPGVTDITQALSIIGKTAQLSFRELKPEFPFDEARFQEYLFNPDAWQETGVTGADLKGADVVFNQGSVASQAPEIMLRFSNEGRSKFSEVAKRNINKPVAIYLDSDALPISAPVVNSDLAQGLTSDPIISGNFSIDEANSLSINLRAGALPVPVTVIEQKTVGATLGEESVRKSIIAGLLGVVIVFAFLIVSYGKLGLLASIALIIYGLLTLALYKGIPVVMTLPGIAGFVLSIGMAVDANILTFERIKEELSWGKPFNHALKLGFDRAWPSIRDSNMSSLITCIILFYLGTGVVRGFALTLAIGIFVSMFTALYVTQTLVSLYYRKGKIK